MIPVGGRTSYLGDVLAVVVADDRETARRAAKLVEVDYDVLAPMVDPVRVVDSDEDAVWELDGNIAVALDVRARRCRAALAASAHRSTRCSRPSASSTPSSNPSRRWPCPSGAGDAVACTSTRGGQGIWDDRDDIAAMLGVDTSVVTTELVSNGGAFGGKEDMSNQAHTALAAWHPRRAGEDHVVARGVAADAPEAPPDPDALRGRLRRRRAS